MALATPRETLTLAWPGALCVLLKRPSAILGPVHTKGSGHVIIHVWNLHKLITNSSNRTYPCSVAM